MSPLSRHPLLRPAAGCLIAALSVAGVLPLPNPLDGPAGGVAAQGTIGQDRAQVTPDPAIEAGWSDPCRTAAQEPLRRPWQPSPSGSECVLEMDACPASALYPVADPVYGYMKPQDPFYGLCEETIRDVDDPAKHTSCLDEEADPNSRYTVEINGAFCTLRLRAVCPLGVSRVGPTTCRRVERRGWSCPPGYARGNQFGACYKPPRRDPILALHPCGLGRPGMSVRDCETYVGRDFIRPVPNPNACSQYELGDPTMSMVHNPDGLLNYYWCRFNARWLTLDCHRLRTPECDGVGAEPAFCLMRTTGRGGCSAVARTIRCRDHQADLMADAERFLRRFPAGDPATDPDMRFTRAFLREEGCAPCPPPNPFDSRPVARYCVEATVSATTPATARDTCDSHATVPACKPEILATRQHYDPVGLNRDDVCGYPPGGLLSWSSSAFPGLAVVNADVRLQVDGLGLLNASGGFRHVRSIRFRLQEGITQAIQSGRIQAGRPGSGEWRMPRGGGVWSMPPHGGDWYDVPQYAEIVPRDHPGLRDYDRDSVRLLGYWPTAAGGELCAIDELPIVRVVARELWPDLHTDRYEIEDRIRDGTFPSSLLDWWNGLDEAARRRVTEARGVPYWNSSLSNAERLARLDGLTETVECSYSRPVWCDWTPTRPGYYELRAQAAWVLRPFEASVWQPRSQRCAVDPSACTAVDVWWLGLRTDLGDLPVRLYTGLEGLRCFLHRLPPRDPRGSPNDDPDDREDLRRLLTTLGLSPADVGFNAALNDLIPWYTNNVGPPCTHNSMGGAGYNFGNVAVDAGCPAIDVRVMCDVAPDHQGRFVQSEPLHIVVHELPVQTRTPTTSP